jgi:hypothetical protein
MVQMGLPQGLVQVIRAFYTGAPSIITLPTGNAPPIPWRIRTKQGCPLSPILFSLCLEQLLRELTKRRTELGYEIGFGDRKFFVNALAHADDLIFITDGEDKLEAMLEILEEFCQCSHMAVNVKKCRII